MDIDSTKGTEKTSYDPAAWKNRVIITLTTKNWKRICAKAPCAVVVDKKWYDIKVNGIDVRAVNQLKRKMAALQKKIDKMTEGAK